MFCYGMFKYNVFKRRVCTFGRALRVQLAVWEMLAYETPALLASLLLPAIRVGGHVHTQTLLKALTQNRAGGQADFASYRNPHDC